MSYSPAVEDQLIEAHVDAVREKRDVNAAFSVFRTGDASVDGALEGGGMGLSTTARDRVTIYDTDTGEPREILVNMLAKTLKKRRGNKPAFSMEPTRVFKRGGIMCYLHPDHPDREELDAIGLLGKVCETRLPNGDVVHAAHIASEFDRDLHMAHRHGREWKVILDWRGRREREEELRLRREETSAIRALVERQSGDARPTGIAPDIYFCEAPGCPRFFDSTSGRSMHANRDHKEGAA